MRENDTWELKRVWLPKRDAKGARIRAGWVMRRRLAQGWEYRELSPEESTELESMLAW